MKDAILQLLKKSRPDFVSGEEICKKLNVTRTAVWKHVKSLREEGYEIDARPRLGYTLTQIPDLINAEELTDGLNSRFIGRKIYYYNVAKTTNDLAKDLAGQGAPNGAIVLAEEQNSGKGRLGRYWHSPKYKGIYYSTILHPPVSLAEASQLTMVSAVALTLAIRRQTGVPVGIKWPNDLLVNGRKLCGILTEMSAEVDRIEHLVVGAGLNVNHTETDFPPELLDIATSLRIESGIIHSRVTLLQAMLEEFENWYTVWLEQGFATVLAKWKELSVSLNRPVRLITIKESWEGWANDVDESGALILRLPDGTQRSFISGEVSLRMDN
ncbi:MAG: biotin--[acetyl-CoA-carboxylase] ligase [Peptococcaceae bacterium]|nr:biotin--[acetyl-CoA-carboxylase] ligase [Peptococcaceae bacterium]